LFIYEPLAAGCAGSSMQQVMLIAQQIGEHAVTHKPGCDKNAVNC
jgi:hypothetical protein